MSHIVKVAVEMKNVACLNKAIAALGLENKGQGRHKLYGGQEAEGIAVTLPDWRHPVVIDTKSGQAYYDNYNGHWGQQIELDKLVQRYTVETSIEAGENNGYTYESQTQENGDIELVMTQLACT